MNFTFMLDYVHQTGGMKRWYSQRIRQEIISELHQADFVQQFSKNVEQQLKQDYV
ncbi:hypothetical protein [Bacteroides acidifaciens]|jgi:hypothetical protein|uniref:hypothetical protein n=1 Tax=Bacteroides acidifaciens TaxID=85831 RepID=UPI00258C06D2|nr:hypothetical protein [Bacteroides acidifaciens]